MTRTYKDTSSGKESNCNFPQWLLQIKSWSSLDKTLLLKKKEKRLTELSLIKQEYVEDGNRWALLHNKRKKGTKKPIVHHEKDKGNNANTETKGGLHLFIIYRVMILQQNP